MAGGASVRLLGLDNGDYVCSWPVRKWQNVPAGWNRRWLCIKVCPAGIGIRQFHPGRTVKNYSDFA